MTGGGQCLPALLVLLASFLLSSACDSETPQGAATIRERWIADDPEVVFAPDHHFESVARFEWCLAEAEDWSSFEVMNQDGALRRSREGVEVPFAERFLKLERDVDFEASGIHRVEVEITGAERGHLQWFWAGEGEPFSEERKIQVAVGGERLVPFDVSAHPRWRGVIRRIGLTPTTAPGQTVVVHAIRGLQNDTDPDALVRVVARPWKVRLGNDLRNALIAPPGLPLEREVEVPRGARLRVAYGVFPRPAEPVGFRVAVRDGGGEPVTLLERRLVPGVEPDPQSGWTDAEVDLAPYAGRRVTLVFETISEVTDLARILPVWANPELVAPTAAATPPNIVLLSIDTLRADRMSAYGHSRPTTPGLDAWVRDAGVRFETVVAPAPWTLPSHVSLFSGLDAVRHGFNYARPASPSVVTLAERLRQAGYSTAAFTAGAYLDPQYGLSQGFDEFRVRQAEPSAEEAGELEAGLAEARIWLAGAPARPFFLFFHTYAVHVPYRARAPYFERFGGDPSQLPQGATITTGRNGPQEREGFLDRKGFVLSTPGGPGGRSLGSEDMDLIATAYDSGVAYMDHHVSRFLADLGTLGGGADTVVILTSDHGEMLGEHGLAGHGSLYDENLLVPLLLSLPDGRAAGRVVADQVRLIDLFPTLLELAGLPPQPGIDGESLLPLLAGRPAAPGEERHRGAWSYAASSNRGLSLRHADRWKYILRNAAWPAVQGNEELYDLRRDPLENDDLGAVAGRGAGLRAEAREHLETKSPALRVRFTNPGPSALRGTLRGAMVDPRGVTSPDLSCPCIRFVAAGILRFDVPPGEELTLHLEKAGPERLEVEGGLAADGPGTSFRETLDLGELERPFELAVEAARIRVWWPGERRSQGEVPVEDEELREQLRALGYLH